MRPIVLGTRGSSLAICQAKRVQAALEEQFPRESFQLQVVTAKADEHPELPLAAMGGEGVFVKALEVALTQQRIDVAVHSLKDLPLAMPEGLTIAAVLERGDPRDALISRSGALFEALLSGVRIGTSSLRRQSQLLLRRKDIKVVELRGNVETRLRRLDEGRYDALVLAACGVIRLGLADRITEYLEIAAMVPEPGQGALALEARAGDAGTVERLSALNDAKTRACVEAERAFLRALGGGCRVPIAAYGFSRDGTLHLEGRVVAADGSRALHGSDTAPMAEAVALGERLAKRLLAQGANALLNAEGSRP